MSQRGGRWREWHRDSMTPAGLRSSRRPVCMTFCCIFTSGTLRFLGDHARRSFLPNIFRVKREGNSPTQTQRKILSPLRNSLLHQRGHLLEFIHGFQGDTDASVSCALGPNLATHRTQELERALAKAHRFIDQETKSQRS